MCSLNYLWNQQQPVHSVQLKFIVKQNLTDQYIQNCFNQIENSSRGEFYGIFKNEFNLEKIITTCYIQAFVHQQRYIQI
jgi:hypothetical protein